MKHGPKSRRTKKTETKSYDTIFGGYKTNGLVLVELAEPRKVKPSKQGKARSKFVSYCQAIERMELEVTGISKIRNLIG